MDSSRVADREWIYSVDWDASGSESAGAVAAGGGATLGMIPTGGT